MLVQSKCLCREDGRRPWFWRPKFPSHKPSSVDFVCLQTEDAETLLPSTYSGNWDFLSVTLNNINLSELLYLFLSPPESLNSTLYPTHAIWVTIFPWHLSLAAALFDAVFEESWGRVSQTSFKFRKFSHVCLLQCTSFSVQYLFCKDTEISGLLTEPQGPGRQCALTVVQMQSRPLG